MKNSIVVLGLFYFGLFVWAEVPVDTKLGSELPTVTPKFKKLIAPSQLKHINVVKTISANAYKNYVKYYGDKKIGSEVYIRALKDAMSKLAKLIVKGNIDAIQENQAIKILIDSASLAKGERVLSVPLYQKMTNKEIDFYIPSEYTIQDVASIVIKEGRSKCAIYSILSKDYKIAKVFINIR